MDNLNIPLEEKINRNNAAAQRAKENGKKKANTKKTKIERYVKETIIITVLNIVITSHVYRKVDEKVQDIKMNFNMHDVHELYNPENETNIIHDNTIYRDYGDYSYDTYNMAVDVLDVNDSLFEPTLFDLYNKMGENRVVGEYHNFDEVIRMLNNNATQEKNPIAFSKVNGCQNFNDYLIKNGFIDENGNPSEEKYIGYSKAMKYYYNNLIDQRLEALNESGNSISR